MKAASWAALVIFALAPAKSSIADTGPETFKTRCAPCHGATGKGDTTMGKNLRLPDLGSPEAQKLSDDELATIITKGKGKMPAYERKLSKEQIEELVKFIRTLKQ
jgi:mono/diheme cytochrome c family protein